MAQIVRAVGEPLSKKGKSYLVKNSSPVATSKNRDRDFFCARYSQNTIAVKQRADLLQLLKREEQMGEFSILHWLIILLILGGFCCGVPWAHLSSRQKRRRPSWIHSRGYKPGGEGRMKARGERWANSA